MFIFSSESFQSLSTDPDQSNLKGTPNKRNQEPDRRVSPRKFVTKKNNLNSPKLPTTSNKMRPLKPLKPGAPKAKAKSRTAKTSTKQITVKRPANSPPEQQESSEQEAPADRSSKKIKATGAAKRKQSAPVMNEMVKLQGTTDNQIPRAPFARLVREIIQNSSPNHIDLRVTVVALEALREAAEIYLTSLFSDAILITHNRKQITLQPRDLQLIMFLKGPGNPQR